MANNDIPNNLPHENNRQGAKEFDKEKELSSYFMNDAEPKEEKEEVPEKDKPSLVQTGTKALAVVGLFAIVGILVWGGAKLTNVAPSALLSAVANFTSIFVPSGEDETIMFSLESRSLNSDETVTVAWTHETKRTGTYVFSYECVEGVTALINKEEVDCGHTFTVPEDETSLSLTLTSSARRFVDVPVRITFIPDEEGATAQADTLITVTNSDVSSLGEDTSSDTGETPSNNTQTGGVTAGTPQNEVQVIGGATGSTGFSDPNGIPDLRVTILATGVVDTLTNAFTPGATVRNGNRAGLHFQVENVGTKASGVWSFIVDLPLTGDKLYVYRPEGTQRSLNPGERIEYTLGFDSVNRRNSTATAVVNVDPARTVGEANRTNNAAEAIILVEKN